MTNIMSPVLCVQTHVILSFVKVLDETMSAFQPRSTKTGGLPNLTWLLRKPEPLGTEFKTVCCAITGLMTVMETQRGRDGMKDIKYNREYGATAGCTMRLAEKSSQELYSTKDIVVGDAWFGSVTAAANLAAEGKDCCLQVKTNTGFFPKKFIMDALENGPGGVNIILKGKEFAFF